MLVLKEMVKLPCILDVYLLVSYETNYSNHMFQDALKKLWRLAFPTREIPPLKSELWKEMGWQGTDPSTDFRLAKCWMLNFTINVPQFHIISLSSFLGVEDLYLSRISYILLRSIRFVTNSLIFEFSNC